MAPGLFLGVIPPSGHIELVYEGGDDYITRESELQAGAGRVRMRLASHVAGAD